MYLTTCVNCRSKEEAIAKAEQMIGHIVIHEHNDGTASINVLQANPVQPAQAKFIFGKTAWRRINQ